MSGILFLTFYNLKRWSSFKYWYHISLPSNIISLPSNTDYRYRKYYSCNRFLFLFPSFLFLIDGFRYLSLPTGSRSIPNQLSHSRENPDLWYVNITEVLVMRKIVKLRRFVPVSLPSHNLTRSQPLNILIAKSSFYHPLTPRTTLLNFGRSDLRFDPLLTSSSSGLQRDWRFCSHHLYLSDPYLRSSVFSL